MAIKLMPISLFVQEIIAAEARHDGYIMSSRGQNPRTGYLIDKEGQKPKDAWEPDGWWFTQYTGKQRTKALYWREHAARVWDCNGMAEGIYEIFSGVNINSKARYNYADWCGIKGKGLIPVDKRVPGAAVFWGSKASSIHHVAYLVEPVDPANPAGDWYIIEARGVLYGVVKTKLYDRDPDFWGCMTKYFDYSEYGEGYAPEEPVLGETLLENGDEGELVKQLQTNLIRLGYDCGRWGADGEFGDATELALMKFQKEYGLEDDGIYGPKSHEAMEKALNELEKPVESEPKTVRIQGGDCWIRSEPDKSRKESRMGVAHRGDVLPYGGQTTQDGWHLVAYKNQNAWVSGKYAKLQEG